MAQRDSQKELTYYATTIRSNIPPNFGVIIFLANERDGDIAVLQTDLGFEIDRAVLVNGDAELTQEEREGGHDVVLIGHDPNKDAVVTLTSELATLYARNRLAYLAGFNLKAFHAPADRVSEGLVHPRYFGL